MSDSDIASAIASGMKWEEGFAISDSKMGKRYMGLRYNTNRWMRGLIGRRTGDRYIASAEGNGMKPLHMSDCENAIMRWAIR